MYASALMAFLHHLAAFTVVAALAVEVALFRPPLSVAQARRLLRTDAVFGAAATLVLIVGLLRVTYFEKGPAYYWHDSYFLLKLRAFIAGGADLDLPDRHLPFLEARAQGSGTVPQPAPERTRRVRLCLMLELTAILVILFVRGR